MFDEIINKVFFLNLTKFNYNKRSETSFSSIYNKEEREIMINIFKRKNPNIFNGKCVRLESIVDNNLNISIISYYDFLLSTIILSDYEKWLEICENNEEKNLILAKVDLLNKNKMADIPDILSNQYLANVIAVSVLVKDYNDNYILVKRKNNLSVSGGLYSVSVTGGVDENDFITENPIFNCALNELKEELNISSAKIELLGFAFPKSKYQPIALFNAKIDCLIDDLIIDKNEIYDIFTIKKADIPEILKENMTETGRYHLLMNYLN